jgi:GDSL-like Lipase/Acylhydrolase family
METAHIVGGNHVTSDLLPEPEQVEARFYVSGVDVLTPDDTAIAVAFGDSWFEGVGSTTGANNRSVDFLNRRLKRGWVVNQGIAGNRLLVDEVGEHALARFDRDVLSIPGLTHVLVHFGINDLGLPGTYGEPPATSDALIESFKTLAHRAHKSCGGQGCGGRLDATFWRRQASSSALVSSRTSSNVIRPHRRRIHCTAWLR